MIKKGGWISNDPFAKDILTLSSTCMEQAKGSLAQRKMGHLRSRRALEVKDHLRIGFEITYA